MSRDGHARHSAYLIENGDLRGFSPDRDPDARLPRALPRRGRPRESFQAWETLERKDRDRVLKLLSLLRIADGLDAAHGSVVGHVGVELSGRSVEIVVSARGDAELERWLLQRKKLLFEELFELPISLEVVPTGPEELQTRASGGWFGLIVGHLAVGGEFGSRGLVMPSEHPPALLQARAAAGRAATGRRRRRRGSAARS